jgi:hypothetical protein
MVNSSNLSLPPQMLALLRKNEKWKRDCMDALETIGRHQFFANLALVENYEMVRGRFIYSHYVDQEEYGDLISQLTKEFQLPSHLRHYDIISQVINTLSGEYQKRPDVFRVKAYDEHTQNNFLRQKTELLVEYVMQQVTQQIDLKLQKEGLDPNRQDFQSEEEAGQYQEQVAQRRQALTPPEIENYMNTKWMDSAEIWAEHQIELDRQRFALSEKEKIEFEDMLISDRCFRHFYVTPNDYNQETWNPINTFYHKSPEVNYVENGDYVGRVFYLSIPEIINRYGHKMTQDQLLQLEKAKKDGYNAMGTAGEGTYSGLKAGSVVPYGDYDNQRFVQGMLGFDPNNPERVEDDILTALGDEKSSNLNRSELFQVTEGYWMSQRKIGKYVYPDEAGQPVTIMVDETFDPRLVDAESIENTFMEFGDDEKLNTITWTWVNQVWKGIKINNKFNNLKEPLYISVQPNEFQFKGDLNIYGAKLPVCGQVFNNRNADSMSLVDLMKPHQIGYNVAMNQLYEIMQREIGRFMLMDFNFIPSGEDWGGPRNFEKLMLVAKQLGIAPLDGSPANTKQSNFAHFQEIDLDESARMISRLKIAEAFENFALKQVGITPQRLGSVAASESATGVQQAVNQSYAQTESYFTNFSSFKRRCLQMNLEIAQFVQSKKESVVVTYTKSDLSRAFIKLMGTELLLSEFGIYVSNSQEVVRQLETMRQLFMENNTTGATPVDLATVIMSNSPAEIRVQLESSWKKTQEQQAQQQQQQLDAQNAQIEAQQKMQAEKLAWETEQRDLDRANDRYIAEVKAMGTATINNSPDQDGNGIPDALEIQKFNAEMGKHSEDILFKKDQEMYKRQENEKQFKLEEERTKVMHKEVDAQKEENEKDRELKREEMEHKERLEKLKIKAKPKPKK